MLDMIWQWLKEIWESLMAFFSAPTRAKTPLNGLGGLKPQIKTKEKPPLDDTDYEFLFFNLLEGMAQGWPAPRVARFFEVMEERGEPELWIPWLQRFGEKLMAAKSPNYEMAERMIRFGEKTRFLPALQELGQVAYNIGSELLGRNNSNVIWEYDGPDSPASPIISDEQEVETVTFDQFFIMLQQDSNLLNYYAEQLGIETDDPQVIITALMQQLIDDQANSDAHN